MKNASHILSVYSRVEGETTSALTLPDITSSTDCSIVKVRVRTMLAFQSEEYGVYIKGNYYAIEAICLCSGDESDGSNLRSSHSFRYIQGILYTLFF